MSIERKRLPDERPSITHKFSIAGHEGYLTIGLYTDTKMPGEISIIMVKGGLFVSGIIDAFAKSVSLNLQYGVPIKEICDIYVGMDFEPSGFTNNRQIPIAKSVIDYIFKYLHLRFLGTDLNEGNSVGDEDAEISQNGKCHHCQEALDVSGECPNCHGIQPS